MQPKTVKKVLLKIEYVGTAYHGWQVQPNGVTVEELIEKALKQIMGRFIKVKACSRTDSGVHALGQVAVIQVPKDTPLKKIFFSVNSILPHDISIVDMVEVEDTFCPRYNSSGKRYRYQINLGKVRKAMDFPLYWWVKYELDIELTRKAAQVLIGTHNFSAFRGKGCQGQNPVKEIRKIDIIEERQGNFNHLIFLVEGSGFLKQMIRIIVGTLVDIGRGKLEAECLTKALKTGNRADLGLTAPPQGLFLEEVFYAPDPFVTRKIDSWDS